MANQFFLPPGAAAGGRFHLTGPEALHVTRVLRHKAGDTLQFFDGKGGRWEGTIVEVHEDGSLYGTLKTLSGSERAAFRLNLYPALIKGNRWDWLLEKAVELGVDSIHPVITQRTVARPEGKPERWERLILAAAKQSERATLPAIAAPLPLADALRTAPGLKLLAWEGAREAALPALPSEVSLFIGPEGGFTEDEVKLSGAAVFGLGPLVLRAETAALAAITLVGSAARQAR